MGIESKVGAWIKVDKVALANLPTPLNHLKDRRFLIKRDDHTGIELSGNKVRKLEYAIAEAVSLGCDTLVTCGGIQSNHCRATAAAAVRLGMESHIILRGVPEKTPQGNLLLDGLLGAKVTWVDADTYATARQNVMESIVESYAAKGKKAYILPEGASNGIGALGYIEAGIELFHQLEMNDLTVKRVYVTVGSGGTYAGLLLAAALLGSDWDVVGIPIAADNAYFIPKIEGILDEARQYLTDEAIGILDRQDVKGKIHLIEGFQGLGYGICEPHEAEFIRCFAREEGIILDPVYTGKAMRGAVEHESGSGDTRAVFIHTGGLYGMFAQNGLFANLSI